MTPNHIAMKRAFKLENEAYSIYNCLSEMEGSRARKITHKLRARWQRRIKQASQAIALKFGHTE
jgi:hypothetical protein